MTSLRPRMVIVTRQTEYDMLLAAHGTRGQAAFFLKSRGQDLALADHRHAAQLAAVDRVKKSAPDDWTQAQVRRDDLANFLFTRNDIVVAIGQDGLVANLAKYVSGQPIIGVPPDPDDAEGILTTTPPENVETLLHAVVAGVAPVQKRAMVEARTGDGQKLAALNELFIGHRSHQSARYVLRVGDAEEAQSSSGVIVSTGTGLSGWARSIMTATGRQTNFGPEDRRAVYFAREPWPSRTRGCALSQGAIDDASGISIVSRLNDGGVIFADGIEQDFLNFGWGVEVKIGLSRRTLNLAHVD